jgi:hypothetical protein
MEFIELVLARIGVPVLLLLLLFVVGLQTRQMEELEKLLT